MLIAATVQKMARFNTYTSHQKTSKECNNPNKQIFSVSNMKNFTTGVDPQDFEEGTSKIKKDFNASIGDVLPNEMHKINKNYTTKRKDLTPGHPLVPPKYLP